MKKILSKLDLAEHIQNDVFKNSCIYCVSKFSTADIFQHANGQKIKKISSELNCLAGSRTNS